MKREDIEEIQEGKKDEVEKLPEKKQKLEDKKKEGEVQTPEIFADPTYDITFKMLFGSDKNKDVLIFLILRVLWMFYVLLEAIKRLLLKCKGNIKIIFYHVLKSICLKSLLDR